MKNRTSRIGPAEVVTMIADATRLKFTRKRIFNLRKAGQFPEPATYVNAKTIFWDRADIEAWLNRHFPADASFQRERAPSPRRKVAKNV